MSPQGGKECKDGSTSSHLHSAASVYLQLQPEIKKKEKDTAYLLDNLFA